MAESLDLFELVLRVTSEGIEKAKNDLAKLDDAQKKQAASSKAQQQEIAKSIQTLNQLASLVDKNDKAAIANLQKLAAAQKDWASQLGASTGQLLKIEQVEKRLDSLAEKSGHTSGEVKKLGSAFEKLASDIFGVSPVAGKLSTTLGELAVGGTVTVGLLAGLAAIAYAIKGPIEGWNEAQKASDDLISSLANQGKALRENGQAALDNALKFARANLLRVQSGQSTSVGGMAAGGLGAAAIGSQSGGALLGALFGAGNTMKRIGEIEAAKDAVVAAEKAIADADEDLRKKKLASDMAMLDFNRGAAEIFKRLADEEKKRAEEAKRALDERIRILTDAMQIDDLRAQASRELTKLESGLTRVIAAGNLPLAKRVELEERLARVRAGLATPGGPVATGPTVGVTPDASNPGFGGKMPTIPASKVKPIGDVINASGHMAVDAMEKLQADLKSATDSLAQTLGDGIYEAFAAAFNGEGLGGIFKAFGKTVLAGIGQIFTMMGQAYIEYGVIMSGLVPTLSNPFTAGPTALAIGALLVALGGALGAISKGAGRGTAGAGAFREPHSVTNDVVRIKFVNRDGSAADLVPRTPVHFTIIGENDPKAQRMLSNMVDKYASRAT